MVLFTANIKPLISILVRFSLDFSDMGDLSPIWGKSVNGGRKHEAGHRHYGGDLTLIDYIIN